MPATLPFDEMNFHDSITAVFLDISISNNLSIVLLVSSSLSSDACTARALQVVFVAFNAKEAGEC